MDKMEVDDLSVVDLSVGSNRREREPLPQVSILPVGLPSTLEIRPVPMDTSRSQPQDLTRNAVRNRPGLDVIPRGRPTERDRDVRTPLGQNQAHVTHREQYERMETDTRPPRRSLRPRQERSYAESPDVFILSDDEPRINGFSNGFDVEVDSDEELPPLPSPPIKELNEVELEEKERVLRKLREELRNEEMKLVLLKKLKQSQQMKENIAVLPTSHGSSASKKLPPPQSAPPPLMRVSKPASGVPPLLRGQMPPSRHAQPPPLVGQSNSRSSSSASNLPPNILLAQQSLPRGTTLGIGSSRPSNSPSNSGLSFTTSSGRDDRSSKDHSSPSTPTTPQPDRKMDEHQTPAQRQAAAKLALRKQLEKTLLQIPPPKPPPPEMHFIPNPSNTEFVYLVGLEYIVDFITKDTRNLAPPEPFRCAQCHTDFTPVWKWEKGSGKGREPRVICEQCVTTNIKKSLKAEHTNRLKTAFVKALQQEQEIEQRLAQADFRASPQPESRRTPPAPSPKPQQSAPLSVPAPKTSSSARSTPTTTSSSSSKYNQHSAAAALHQQLMRGHQPLPAHMMPFSPLLYPYQLMAQVASSKSPVAAAQAAANLAEMQRQYLLDLARPHHWKT